MKNITQTVLKQYAQQSETYSASKPGGETAVDRNVEKLVKFERPSDLSEMTIKSIDTCPFLIKLDLPNIEPYTETGPVVHVDLGLDQIEEPED